VVRYDRSRAGWTHSIGRDSFQAGTRMPFKLELLSSTVRCSSKSSMGYVDAVVTGGRNAPTENGSRTTGRSTWPLAALIRSARVSARAASALSCLRAGSDVAARLRRRPASAARMYSRRAASQSLACSARVAWSYSR
jgi:hypothetical protein